MIESDRVLRFHEFEFSARQMELRKHGHRIRISASQLRLLTLFLDRPAELVTRDEVINRLWSDTATIDTVSGVNTAINRLRFHLGDDANTPRFLETVIGMGYRFIAPVEEIQPILSAEAAEPESSSSQVEIPSVMALPEPLETAPSLDRQLPASYRRPLFWAVAGVLLLMVAVAWTVARRHLLPKTAVASAIRFSPATFNYGGQRVAAAAISGDGKLLVYADNSGLRVRELATGGEYSLATLPTFAATGLSWFPGSKQIAVSGTDFNAHRQVVWLVSIKGVDASVLTNDADLATVSPDGRLIAVARSDRQKIDLIHQDGTPVRELVHADSSRAYSFLSWSPDGRNLIAISHHAAAGGATEPGQWLYEYIRVADGAVLTREADAGIRSAVMLQDGRLQYVGPSSGVNPITAGSVFSVRTDASTGRFLGAPAEVGHLDAAALTGIAASADGSKLAVIASVPAVDILTATLQRNAAGFPAALENIRRLTSSASDAYPHAWATDRSILYEGNSQGHLAVIAQRPDETAPRVLGQFPFSAVMAQLSPDGRFVLFIRLAPNGRDAESIYRMPIEGGEPQKVAGTDGVDEFRCALKGPVPCILRKKEGNRERLYFALDPVSGAGRLLGRSPWQPFRRGDWGVSPDGTMVAVADHDPANPALNFLPLNGAQGFARSMPIRGHGSPLGVSWDVDGRSLFLETRNSNNFELLSVTLDGHAQLLRKSSTVIFAVSSPDGKSIAFPDPTLNSNVWVSNTAP